MARNLVTYRIYPEDADIKPEELFERIKKKLEELNEQLKKQIGEDAVIVEAMGTEPGPFGVTNLLIRLNIYESEEVASAVEDAIESVEGVGGIEATHFMRL